MNLNQRITFAGRATEFWANIFKTLASEHKMKNRGGEEWIKEAEIFMEENFKRETGHILCQDLPLKYNISLQLFSVSHPDCSLC